MAEADALLQSMLVQVRSALPGDQRDLQQSHQARQLEWERIKRSLVLGAPLTSPAAAPSDRLMQGQRILHDTNQSVFRATQIAQENEAIGSEVMAELGIQREALVR